MKRTRLFVFLLTNLLVSRSASADCLTLRSESDLLAEQREIFDQGGQVMEPIEKAMAGARRLIESTIVLAEAAETGNMPTPELLKAVDGRSRLLDSYLGFIHTALLSGKRGGIEAGDMTAITMEFHTLLLQSMAVQTRWAESCWADSVASYWLSKLSRELPYDASLSLDIPELKPSLKKFLKFDSTESILEPAQSRYFSKVVRSEAWSKRLQKQIRQVIFGLRTQVVSTGSGKALNGAQMIEVANKVLAFSKRYAESRRRWEQDQSRPIGWPVIVASDLSFTARSLATAEKLAKDSPHVSPAEREQLLTILAEAREEFSVMDPRAESDEFWQ